jgi:hypothetical protein
MAFLPMPFLLMGSGWFLVRLITLFISHQVEAQSIKHVKELNADQKCKLGSALLKNRNFFELNSNLWKFIVGIFVVPGLVVLALSLYNNFYACQVERNQFDCISKIVFPQRLNALVTMFVQVCFSYLAIFALRNFSESLEIKKEMKLKAIAFHLLLVLLLIEILSFFHFRNEIENVFGFNIFGLLWSVIPVYLFIYSSTYFVVAKILKSKADIEKFCSNTEQEKLLQILETCEGFDRFKSFLEKEFSAENILFWEMVENYKTGSAEANTIYSTFVTNEAPLSINISHNTRNVLIHHFSTKKNGLKTRFFENGQNPLIRFFSSKFMKNTSANDTFQQLESPISASSSVKSTDIEDRSIFNKAQSEIIRLLANDSFQRFKLMDGYHTMITSLETRKPRDPNCSKLKEQGICQIQKQLFSKD